MEKPNIILIGGGGHCKSCIDVIEQENKFNIAGIVDSKNRIGQRILGYPIIGCDEDLKELNSKFGFFLITIGQITTPELRKKIFKEIKELGGNFPLIISPNSYVSKSAKIGNGTIALHGTIINPDSQIGENCIINTGSIIEHDSIIYDNCHISTRVTINGNCIIKNGTFIGSGSILNQRVSIAKNCIIGSGSLVLKNILTEGSTSHGTPSKTIS